MTGRSSAGLSLKELSEIACAKLRGDPQRMIRSVATLQDAVEGTIGFLANPRYKSQLADTAASAVILSADDAADCPVDCLIADNIYLAHARVTTALHPFDVADPGIHDSAWVDPSASVASTAEIAANVYVGPGVVIEDDVIVGPGCVLLEDVTVGQASRLIASVTLCAGTKLGRRCVLQAGAVVGGDGFGLANDQGRWVKVPQIGRVVIGDDVEIQACASIDRGAIGDTVIADGVKIDSHVHIAHNVQIGEHTAIAGCTGIAGSTRVGAYCTIAGAAAITGHVELADHVHISGMTTVTRSIRKPGTYTGTIPATEHATWLKNFSRLRQLDDMARRIKALERELGVLQNREDGHG